jgi:hypothetical protein
MQIKQRQVRTEASVSDVNLDDLQAALSELSPAQLRGSRDWLDHRPQPPSRSFAQLVPADPESQPRSAPLFEVLYETWLELHGGLIGG